MRLRKRFNRIVILPSNQERSRLVWQTHRIRKLKVPITPRLPSQYNSPKKKSQHPTNGWGAGFSVSTKVTQHHVTRRARKSNVSSIELGHSARSPGRQSHRRNAERQQRGARRFRNCREIIDDKVVEYLGIEQLAVGSCVAARAGIIVSKRYLTSCHSDICNRHGGKGLAINCPNDILAVVRDGPSMPS